MADSQVLTDYLKAHDDYDKLPKPEKLEFSYENVKIAEINKHGGITFFRHDLPTKHSVKAFVQWLKNIY